MRHPKMLIAVAAVVALLAPATASATQLTSPNGTAYTGTIQAQSSALAWHGAFVSVTCNNSSMDGTVSNHGESVTAQVVLSSLKYSECNFPFRVLKAGSFELHTENSTINNGNGTITWSGMELTWETSIANCIFTTQSTHVGVITGSDTANAKWEINSATIPRTGHSVFCGSSATLTGSYTITTPSVLTVD